MASPHHHYRIFDLGIGSDIEIPELPRCHLGIPELRFTIAANPLPEAELRWQHEWLDADNRRAIACAQFNAGAVLRFSNIADFQLDPTYTSITAYPHSGTPSDVLRHLLIDQVVPRTLAQQGQVVIHASAVRVPGGCIAFLGPSGAGKSTLAASFLSVGGEPFADDAIKINAGRCGLTAIPSYPGLRMWPAAEQVLSEPLRSSGTRIPGSAKQRFAGATHRQPQALNLLAVFTLNTTANGSTAAATPSIRECTGAQSLADLIRHTFVLNPRSRTHQIAQLHSLSLLVNAEPRFFHLSFPRRFDILPAVRTAAMNAIGTSH